MRDLSHMNKEDGNPFDAMAFVDQSPVAEHYRSTSSTRNIGTWKRRIIDSDDDDDDVPTPQSTNPMKSISSTGWLEKRDVTSMSASEIEANKKIAKAVRANSHGKLIPKRRKIVSDDDYDDRVSDIEDDDDGLSHIPAPKPAFSHYKHLEDNLSVLEEQRAEMRKLSVGRKQMKSNDRALRAINRSSKQVQKRRINISDDSDNDDEKIADSRCRLTGGNAPNTIVVLSGSEGDGVDADDTAPDGVYSRWQDSDSDEDEVLSARKAAAAASRYQSEVEKKSSQVLQRCIDLSHQLRSELRSWGGSEERSMLLSATAQDADIGDCVNMTTMTIDSQRQSPNSIALHTDRSTSSSLVPIEDKFISQALVSSYCPSLQLKDYQVVGVNWLKLLHSNDVNGVLADDMGLGKTIQTIAFLGWLHTQHNSSVHKNQGQHRPHLIVVPGSTLGNWSNELHRFCPSLRVVVYHGSPKEKQRVKRLLKKALLVPSSSCHDGVGAVRKGQAASSADEIHIVLATYTMFERESGAEDRSLLKKINFDYLVLDEAHCIKNSSSSRYYHLRNLRTHRRLLLSGTPVQNDVTELLALLGFLMPQVFKADHMDLLLESFHLDSFRPTHPKTSSAVTTTEGDGGSSSVSTAAAEGASLENLRRMLAPFVLRRLKSDVLHQLVPKRDEVVILPMSTAQQSVYDGIIERHVLRKRKQQLQLTVDGGDAGGIVGSLSSSEANNIFTSLRKACNHPLLLRRHFDEEDVLRRIATVCYATGRFGVDCDFQRVYDEILQFSDFDINHLCLDYPSQLGDLQLSSDTLYESPKLQKMRTMLPQLISAGHRILVFSQWTRMMDIIGAFLDDINITFLRLDGSTPIKERQDLIDTFDSSDIPVFVLSTKAGGLGINLTAADTVILHDLDFNPENDRQAEDRCHRIGQTKLVTVYKLVAQESVDESIFDMGERKKRLSHAVLQTTGQVEVEVQDEVSVVGGDGSTGAGAVNSQANGRNAKGGDDINQMLRSAVERCMLLKSKDGVS